MIKLGTGPADSDGDGLPDAWELFYFGNPTNGTASIDSDGDGADNFAEYVAGTLPLDASSYLVLQSFMDTNGVMYIVWPSVADRSYDMLQSLNLLSNDWVAISSNIPATAPTNTYIATPATNAAFFQLEVQYP